MDLDRIRELIALAREHDLIEMEVREGEQTIRFRRAEVAVVHATDVARGPAELTPAQSAVVAPALTGYVLKAPMAGTFFRAPAPGTRPFVEVGSRVEATSVVAIIESMKMMNPVEAGCAGTVSAMLVANSERVQIDQPLVTIS